MYLCFRELLKTLGKGFLQRIKQLLFLGSEDNPQLKQWLLAKKHLSHDILNELAKNFSPKNKMAARCHSYACAFSAE